MDSRNKSKHYERKQAKLSRSPPQKSKKTQTKLVRRSSFDAEDSKTHLPRPSHMEQCQNSLLNKLTNLKKLTLLHNSLLPSDASSDFELLEFYGDSVLYERISFFLMQTRRFMSPHLLTTIRCAIINNKNLAAAYENLQLQTLLSSQLPLSNPPHKAKADVVEAIIGELSELISKSGSANASVAKGVLDELLAFICYTGEQTYFNTPSKAVGSSQAAPTSPMHANPPKNDKPAHHHSVEFPSKPIQQYRPLSTKFDTNTSKSAPQTPSKAEIPIAQTLTSVAQPLTSETQMSTPVVQTSTPATQSSIPAIQPSIVTQTPPRETDSTTLPSKLPVKTSPNDPKTASASGASAIPLQDSHPHMRSQESLLSFLAHHGIQYHSTSPNFSVASSPSTQSVSLPSSNSAPSLTPTVVTTCAPLLPTSSPFHPSSPPKLAPSTSVTSTLETASAAHVPQHPSAPLPIIQQTSFSDKPINCTRSLLGGRSVVCFQS